LYGTTLRYAFYYVLLEPFAGVAWTLLVGVPSFLTATWYRAARGDAACANALVVHLLSWYMQIHPGHAVFEKRRPALTESLFQVRSIQTFFTHRPVSTFDRVSFQLTDELFLYGTTLSRSR